MKLRADKTDDNPEADQLLEELGNSARSIPYLAVFCASRPAQPFTLRDLYTKGDVLRILAACQPGTAAGSSGGAGAPLPTTKSAQLPANDPGRPRPPNPTKDQAKSNATAKHAASIWQPFDIARFRERRAAGRPVIVDWTADW